jgi:hypothetical protein
MVKNLFNHKEKTLYAIVVFFIAFFVRFLIGFFTFGSVDLLNAHQGGMDAIAHNHDYGFPYYPYFYYINLFSEFLNRVFMFPIGIAHKFLPIIFDSIIASLIFISFVFKTKKINFSFLVASLYVISPISILMTSIHCQWDAIALAFVFMAFFIKEYYLVNSKALLIVGILLAISFCMKPYTLMFAPFLLPAINFKSFYQNFFLKKYVYKILTIFSGFIIALVFSFLIFKISHFDIKRITFLVFDYSIGHRPLIFGLNFSSYFGFLYNYRLYFLAIVFLILFILNLKSKMNSFLCASLLILAILSCQGLAPQYIFWPLPFILMSGHFSSFVIYQIIFTPVFISYYLIPYYSFEKYENMATFSTLINYEWLMPNVNLMISLEKIRFLPLVLNTILPLVMGIIFLLSILLFLINKTNEINNKKNEIEFSLLQNPFLWIILIIFVSVAVVNIVHNLGIIDLNLYKFLPFESVYSVSSNLDAPKFLTGNFELGSVFNFPYLLIFFLLIQIGIFFSIRKN